MRTATYTNLNKVFAKGYNSAKVRRETRKSCFTMTPLRRTGKTTQGSMTYYELLLKHVGRVQKQHPRSVLMLNANTFEVQASARNMASLQKKANGTNARVFGPTIIVSHLDFPQLTTLRRK